MKIKSFLFLILLLFSGCQTWVGEVYEPAGAESHLAIVEGLRYIDEESEFKRWMHAGILRIDDLAVKEENLLGYLYGSKPDRKIPVGSGKREFFIHFKYYSAEVGRLLESFLTIEAEIEKRTSYRVCAKVSEDNSKSIVWIEKLDSGERASEEVYSILRRAPIEVVIPI